MAAGDRRLHHFWLFTEDARLVRVVEEQQREAWIKQSLKVFAGHFTCGSDREKLVGVVLALYAFSIAAGRSKESGPDELWLGEHIEQNKRAIFPSEW